MYCPYKKKRQQVLVSAMQRQSEKAAVLSQEEGWHLDLGLLNLNIHEK